MYIADKMPIKVVYSNKDVELEQVDSRKYHKIFGVWISPVGNNVRQKGNTKNKVSKWHSPMVESPIPGFLKV